MVATEHLGEREDLGLTERERVGAELLDLTSGPAPGQGIGTGSRLDSTR